MKKYLFFVLVLYLLQFPLGTMVFSQQWAESMFEERRHSFGSVAIGVEAVHRFKFKNPYPEDVHVASVTSSCGCTSVFWPKKTIRYGETGEIVAKLNTDGRFKENKSATLTVIIDRPHRAEVQLQVTSYIRPDVVVTPGNAEFGTVSEGKEISRKLRMQYAGQPNWQLVKIERTNPHIEVRADEVERDHGRVVYDITVTMLESMPSGYVHDMVRFVTNDNSPNGSVVLLPVQGYVTAPLVATPSPFVVGFVKPGETIKKNLVLRSETPFRITKITSRDKRFQFSVSNLEHKVHVLPIVFSADSEFGDLAEPIVIHTSLDEHQQILLTTQGKVFDNHWLNDPRQMLAEHSPENAVQSRENTVRSVPVEPVPVTEKLPAPDTTASNNTASNNRAATSFRIEMPPRDTSTPPQKAIATNTAVKPIEVEPEKSIAATQELIAEVDTNAQALTQESQTMSGLLTVTVEDVDETPVEPVPTVAASPATVPDVPVRTMPVTSASPLLAAAPQANVEVREQTAVSSPLKVVAPNSVVPSVDDWEELQFDHIAGQEAAQPAIEPVPIVPNAFAGNANHSQNIAVNNGISNIAAPVDSTIPDFEIVADTVRPDHATTTNNSETQRPEIAVAQTPNNAPTFPLQSSPAQPVAASNIESDIASMTRRFAQNMNDNGGVNNQAVAKQNDLTTQVSPVTEPQGITESQVAQQTGSQQLVFARPSVKNNLALITETQPEPTNFADVFDIVGEPNDNAPVFATDNESQQPVATTGEASPLTASPRIARAIPITNAPKIPPVHGMAPTGESRNPLNATTAKPVLLPQPPVSIKPVPQTQTQTPVGDTSTISNDAESLIASLFGSANNENPADITNPKSADTVTNPVTTIEPTHGGLQPLESADLGSLTGSLSPINHDSDANTNAEKNMPTMIRQPETNLSHSRLHPPRAGVAPVVPPNGNDAQRLVEQGAPIPNLMPNRLAQGNPAPTPGNTTPSNTMRNNAMRGNTVAGSQNQRQSQGQVARQPQQNVPQRQTAQPVPQQQLTPQQMQQRALYQQQLQQRAMQQQLQQRPTNSTAVASANRNVAAQQNPANTRTPQQQQILAPPPQMPQSPMLMTPAPVFR